MGQIGSLWYNIGAKTAELQKALTDSKSKLTQFKTGLNEVTRSVTGMDLSTAASAAGIGILVNEYKKAIESTMEYAYQVRTLSRDIGGTPEDISKLIQAADDAQVSFESLKTAMVMANKQGVDVTIEGMSKLADQYLAIQDPLDRTRFLTDTFGRSGEQLGALMEMGSAGIKLAGEEAAKYGRILSENAIKQTEKFRIAQDNLDDSLSKMKDTMALEVMPSLTALINTVNPVINAYNSLKSAVNGLDPALKGIITTFYGLLDPINMILGPIKGLYDAIVGLLGAIGTLNGTTVNVPSIYTSANATAMGIGTGTKKATTNYGVKSTSSGVNVGGSTYGNNHGANGLDMIVPAGYQNDNYPLMAKTGERVKIDPVGKSSSGMSDAQYKALLESVKPNYDQMANAFAKALSRVGR